MTKKGCEICVIWKDGSIDCLLLKDIKQYYPIELSYFMQLYGMHEYTAFAWWVQYVERKRETIISKLKSKYWKRTHKYIIKILK